MLLTFLGLSCGVLLAGLLSKIYFVVVVDILRPTHRILVDLTIKAPYKKLFHVQFLPLFPKHLVLKYLQCPNLGLFGPFSFSLIPRYKVA